MVLFRRARAIFALAALPVATVLLGDSSARAAEGPAGIRPEPEIAAPAPATMARQRLALAPALRFTPPQVSAPRAPRPKIALIVDDLGLDRAALDEVVALPGPLTVSLLPYGRDLEAAARRARAAGHAVMLHLPMEPVGDADPGPHALTAEMDAARLAEEIAWNLSRFDGFTGVNNHMGSKLTSDEAAMETVMAALRPHAVYFVDSVTIATSRAKEAAERAGLPAYARDVFLDDAPGRKAILARIAELEARARAQGVAIGIVHPRAASLEAIGAWLATAPARGFELVTMDDAHAETVRARSLLASAGAGS